MPMGMEQGQNIGQENFPDIDFVTAGGICISQTIFLLCHLNWAYDDIYKDFPVISEKYGNTFTC